MTAGTLDFVHSTNPEPHRARTKEILRRHPEIRELIGPNPMTLFWTAFVVAIQVAAAYFVHDHSWWIVVAVAYTVGAFSNHALFVLIHECAHRLVFKKALPNRLTGLLADIPLFFPSSVAFRKYHLKHHAFQGIYELDADLPYRWEARLIGRSPIAKALWLLFYPVVQGLRPLRLREVALVDKWSIANLIIQIAFNMAVFMLWGPKALVYFALSLFFSIGLHPLGARWIQRHYLTADGEQETFSYYGPLNKLAFNVGYHNEHHDFPSVAWNRLPQIRAIAPEVYDNLSSHQSWTRLFFRFLFDRNLTLFSRVVRGDRGGVGLDDDVKPDVETAATT